MRLLILATTKFAPTYNEKLISQINYFNSFDNMKADIFIDASLVEIEKMLSTSQYDLIYPTTVFDYSNDGSSIISFNSYLYKLLEYYNINYIGSPLFSHLLLNDKALTNLESGMGLPNQIVTRQAWIANRKSVEKKLLTFKLPAIVKPNTLAASLGIDESSIIWNTDDFGKIIDQRFQSFPHLTEILIESYLNDATEYTVSITGNTGRYLFNVSKLKSKTQHHALHSYKSKLTISEKRDFTYVIEDNRGVLYELQKHTEQLFEQMHLRDMARFDYLQDKNGKLYLIDANSLPALSNNYLYEYISTRRLRLEQLLLLICLVAQKRIGLKINTKLLEEYPVEIVRALF